MTAKQKAAREKFKAVVKEAAKLRKKNPKLTQAEAVKQAWAISYSKAGKGKKVAAIKIVEKGESKKAKPKATYQQKRTAKGTFKGLKKIGAASSKVKAKKGKSTEMHTDTKSHNVNIRVVSGMKRDVGYIGKAIIKKYTISELKKLNPVYFAKGQDKMFGVYKRKLMLSPKLQSQVMIEAHKNIFGGEVFREYTIRKISSDGQIERPERFDNLLAASVYIGKNIIL